MADLQEIGAQCFVSYHRRDNETYDGVVDRLVADVRGRFEAETGRSLEVFVDRESIPGGGDWRAKIAESIASATIFVPIVTMRYFASARCREELIAFYDSAERLGVTELILPVVLAGQENITPDDPRQEVQIIERLNYRAIGEAYEAGYQSAAWKAAMRQLVADIARGLQIAEEAIARTESTEEASTPQQPADDDSGRGGRAIDGEEPARVQSPTVAPDAEDADDEDIFSLGERVTRLTPLAEAATSTLAELGEVVSGFNPELARLEGAPAREQRAFLLRLSAAVSPISARLGSQGAKFEAEVRAVDRIMRGIIADFAATPGPLAQTFRTQLTTPLKSLETGDTFSQIESMSQTLTAVALLNVSLRKSLQPAIRGLRSLRNAVSIVNSWPALAND